MIKGNGYTYVYTHTHIHTHTHTYIYIYIYIYIYSAINYGALRIIIAFTKCDEHFVSRVELIQFLVLKIYSNIIVPSTLDVPACLFYVALPVEFMKALLCPYVLKSVLLHGVNLKLQTSRSVNLTGMYKKKTLLETIFYVLPAE